MVVPPPRVHRHTPEPTSVAGREPKWLESRITDVIVHARQAGWHTRLARATDASVVEASLEDAAAFATLFDRHAPVIHRYLARRAGQAADDLVADTFVAAFANRARYDLSYADARPWLYGIASKELVRHFRSQQREQRIGTAMRAVRAVPGHAGRVASDATAEAMREELEVALSTLAPGDRDVLVLIAWEELTYDEVARALDIPIGTVRSRLHRARSQLRLVLDQLADQETIKEVLSNE